MIKLTSVRREMSCLLVRLYFRRIHPNSFNHVVALPKHWVIASLFKLSVGRNQHLPHGK
jgi:hypothetical protein